MSKAIFQEMWHLECLFFWFSVNSQDGSGCQMQEANTSFSRIEATASIRTIFKKCCFYLMTVSIYRILCNNLRNL